MAMSLRDMCLLYDEEFNRNFTIAKFLVKHLHEKREMQLANKWLIRVSNIKSPVLEVKKNRNAFLSYMVKVLGDGVLTGCTADSENASNTVCDPDNTVATLLENPTGSDFFEENTSREPEEVNTKMEFHSRWSDNHRTYVAVKPLPGRGALLYLASSKNSGLHNWDFPSTKK